MPSAISGSCHQVSTGLPSYCCTRKSAARVPAGDSGLNHISSPCSSRIIGPYCPIPEYGARNRSPPVAVCALRGHGHIRRAQFRARVKLWYSFGAGSGAELVRVLSVTLADPGRRARPP